MTEIASFCDYDLDFLLSAGGEVWYTTGRKNKIMSDRFYHLNYLIVSIVCGLGLVLLPTASLATSFDPGYIIADEDVLDKNAMSQASIQQFLVGKPGTLANYQTTSEGKDKDGNDIVSRTMLTSEAIYEISQRWGISPKFLLVLAQKEQSLVEDDSPSQKQYDWATGYAVCDNCSLSDPAIQRWKGFYKQLNSAAAQFEYYLANPGEFRFKRGETYTIDGVTVAPITTATAALYNYTPHMHGNELFHTIWKRYFGKMHPDGSLLQAAGESGVWYIQYGTRRPIQSKAALQSRFNINNIITVTKSDLESYQVGWPISLPNYAVVRSPTKYLYLIVDDEKRPIMSNDVLKKIGVKTTDIIDATGADLDNFFEGMPVTLDSVYPQGILAQDSVTGGVYFVQDENKYPIVAKEIIAVNFPGRTTVKLSPAELEKFTTGDPIMFRDGTLLKPAEYPEVYVVSNGKRLWIPDEATFVGLGYKWSNIVTTSYEAVAKLPLGPVLTP